MTDTTAATGKKYPDLTAYFVPDREKAYWTSIGAALEAPGRGRHDDPPRSSAE